ncbi:MAG: radical SAM protein [Desulfobacteraceae bacterium]
MGIDLSSVKPFEISSIRPPTENYSLTFRLTRNCYWNRCGFCPAYKFASRFSKRGMDEVKEDISRAKLMDELLYEQGISGTPTSYAGYSRITELVHRIKTAQKETGHEVEGDRQEPPEDLHPDLVWFLSWFKDKPDLMDSLNHILTWRMAGGKTCFLGDADSLIIKPEFMTEILDEIKDKFISIQRFTVYGRTKTAARVRKVEELEAYRNAGLDRIHFGLESGSDAVLKFMDKGVTKDEHVEAGIKTREAGLSCSVYAMPGLGGSRWSEAHAHETAEVLTKMTPDYVRLRTLQIFPQTPLDKARRNGGFVEASEERVVKEIRIIVEETDTETEILSDSASNLLSINGRLPEDRPAMLREIDQYLALSDRDKLLFSAESRLRSFVGQYGGLSEDISGAISPYLRRERLDFSSASDSEIEGIIGLIRSKLMP